MFRPVSRVYAAALAVALLPAAATAQKVSISPTIGVYIPTTELLKAANGDQFKQEVGLAVGGRLGVNVSPRFGILTTVTYVPSDLKLDLATGQQEVAGDVGDGGQDAEAWAHVHAQPATH